MTSNPNTCDPAQLHHPGGTRDNVLAGNDRVRRRYLDLCNDEMFYFQHRYLPDEVAREWIDGMFSILPLLRPQGEVVDGHQDRSHWLELLAEFPRLVHALTLETPAAPKSPQSQSVAAGDVLQRVRACRY